LKFSLGKSQFIQYIYEILMTFEEATEKIICKKNISDFGYRIIQIEVTNRCNMGCSFCGLPIRDAKLKDIDLNDVFKILDQIADYDGIEFIAFHQFGETLLYPEIWECIDYCRKLGLKSQLITNGLLLTEKNIDLLLKHPPDIFRVSAQSIHPQHHKPMRGIEMEFSNYINRIADCIARLLDTDHGITEIRTDLAVNDNRYFGIRGTGKYLKELFGITEPGDPTIFSENPKTTKAQLVDFLKLIESKSQSFKFNEEHLLDCLNKYYSTNSGEGWETAYILKENNQISYKIFHNGRRFTQYYPVNKAKCGTEIIGILADGTVTCCCIDYDGLTGLGNIFNDDLYSILDKNRGIIEGLHKTGDLAFDICKHCMGSPKKLGAWIKNTINHLRY